MKQKFMLESPSTQRSRQQLALPWAILIGIAVGVTLSLLAFTALTLHRYQIANTPPFSLTSPCLG